MLKKKAKKKFGTFSLVFLVKDFRSGRIYQREQEELLKKQIKKMNEDLETVLQ